jgi:hypothetical protein
MLQMLVNRSSCVRKEWWCEVLLVVMVEDDVDAVIMDIEINMRMQYISQL